VSDDERDPDEAEILREVSRQLRGFAELNDKTGFLKWLNRQPAFALTSPRAVWLAGRAWRDARAEFLEAQRRRVARAAAQRGKA